MLHVLFTMFATFNFCELNFSFLEFPKSQNQNLNQGHKSARHVIAAHLEQLQLVPSLLKIVGTPSSVFTQFG